MRHLFVVSLILFIVALAFTTPSRAAELLDDATGGDCAIIGSWDAGTRTCTLTADLNDNVFVLSPGLTLDCATHAIFGPSIPNIGVWIFPGSGGSTVRNCVIENFGTGILVVLGNDHVFTDNYITDNASGIRIFASDNNSITNNSFARNRKDRALAIVGSFNSRVANNSFTNNGFGITLSVGGSHEIRDNLFVGNGLPRVLPAGNSPTVALAGENSNDNVITGNVMIDNAYGFGLSGTGNSVDTSNTVDGKPIYWFRDLVGGTISPAVAPGAAGIFCDRCTGVTIRGFDLTTPMGIAIGLYETVETTVEDNVIEDSSFGVLLPLGSDSNAVLDNEISLSFEDVFAFGIRLFGADRNLIARNSIDLGPGNSGWHGISLGRHFGAGSLDPADLNVVVDNSVTRTLQPAIEVGGSFNLIEGNTLIDTGGGITVEGFGVDKIDNIIRENVIREGRDAWFPFTSSPGTFAHGVTISNANGTLVARNIVSRMRDHGLFITGSVGTAVTRNDIFDNARTGLDNDGNAIFEVASFDGSGENAVAIELSVGGIGNYWGRNCGLSDQSGSPLFQAGVDSNSSDVVDSNPFGHPVTAIEDINGLLAVECPM